MSKVLRFRSLGGAVVTWRKIGTSGDHYNYDVGDIKCLGCGVVDRGRGTQSAESHAGSCKALG